MNPHSSGPDFELTGPHQEANTGRPRRHQLRRRSARGSTSVDEVKLDPKTRNRVVGASFVGNFVEWFDYGAYSFFAVAIGAAFFPEGDKTAQLLGTYGILALSFLIRPLGGFFWGRLGDRVGRKKVLGLSILIMSAATFGMGLLPTYAAIGAAAPVLLFLMRVIQGFSAAGEYAGASAFLVEYAPRRKRGFYAAMVPASTATGMLAGSLFATVMSLFLNDAEMADWGWRVPFLLAAPLGLVGSYIRSRLEESPVFEELEAEAAKEHAPIGQLYKEHGRALLLTFGAVLLNAVGFYTVLTYMPTYFSTVVGLNTSESFTVTTIGSITYVGFILVVGRLSDRFGRRRVLMAGSVAFMLLTVPMFMVLGSKSIIVATLVMIALGGMLTLNDGCLPSFLAEQFPTAVRYSGFAVSFNLANALFGGSAPFISTSLIKWTGNNLAPAWYLAAAAAISLLAVYKASETARRPLEN